MTGVVFVLFFWRIVIAGSGYAWEAEAYKVLAVYLVMASALIVVTFVDAKYFIIPDSISIGGAILGPIVSFIYPAIQNGAWGRDFTGMARVDGLLKSLVGLIDVQISPSSFAIIAGLSISTGIGVIFGIYPAMKAARLDPIKALSYE